MSGVAARAVAEPDRFATWGRDLGLLRDVWDVDPSQLTKMPSDENLVLRASVGDTCLALRGSAEHHRTISQVRCELKMIACLDAAGVAVARPVSAPVKSISTGITWAAFEWLDAPATASLTAGDCYQWGRSAALLNDVLATLPDLPGAVGMADDARYRFKDWLPVGDPLLPSAMFALDQMCAPCAPHSPSHGDPTPDNYRCLDGSITWFDFDDWGEASPERDLAVALTWLARRHDCRPPVESVASLVAGYQSGSARLLDPVMLAWALEVQLVEALATQSRSGQRLPAEEDAAIRSCVMARSFSTWVRLDGTN